MVHIPTNATRVFWTRAGLEAGKKPIPCDGCGAPIHYTDPILTAVIENGKEDSKWYCRTCGEEQVG